ncbi:hypothetical protein N9N67_11880 [Bacteriovoracaceae bacterium]|nr:hypothetical protein [Bacteriovoracaceae bacterium]
MKKLTTTLMLFFCFVPGKIFAEDLMCYYKTYSLFQEISKYTKQISDKTQHCTLSCQLTIYCNKNYVISLGYLKELRDLGVYTRNIFKKNKKASPSIDDLKANKKGVDYSLEYDPDEEECFDYCLDQYEYNED